LASGFTTSNGSFLLKGHEWEISNIDPVLKIFHKCNDKGIPCERIWPIALPAKYITFGSEQPSKIMDIGILNLEVVLFRESRECVVNRQQHSTDY
uniref:Transthyretin-like family protein n=1 Tax=Anisakis simplex TaxID=6269 RepID=A0A0M3JXV2_ANISI